MNKPVRLQVAFAGNGARALRWAAACDSRANIKPPAGEWRSVDALVVAPGVRDALSLAREALDAGRPVLFAAPLPTPRDLAELKSLSDQSGALLHVAEPFRHEPGFVLLRKMISGRDPLWRALYVRTESLGRVADMRREEAALEDLAICHALIDGNVASVSAATQHCALGALSIAISYREGPMVQCTISPAEEPARRQLVLVTKDGTVAFNRGASGHQLTATLFGSEAMRAREACCAWRDPFAEETACFLQALQGECRDSSDTGLRRWQMVAEIWEAVRRSVHSGSSQTLVRDACATAPLLRVIEGGGMATGRRAGRPLTLVARL